MANSYLNRTVSSASNRRTFTFSAWIKRSKLGTVQSVIGADSGGGTNFGIQFQTNDTLAVFQGSSTFLVTTQVFKDTSAWYHLVLAVDTTNSTADNRVRLYNNGTEITSFGTRNNPSVNTDLAWNNNVDNTVGADKPTSGVRNYFDGYISHAANVDGQQLAPTVFGETDSTSGIWKFKSPSGVTWGTNGFHLKFENSGALGTDSSGNSNTFTVNGNLKQALDTPSNVFCTLNPLNQTNSGYVFSNGNTKGTVSGAWLGGTGTLAMSSGKYYWEVKYGSGNYGIGLAGWGTPSTKTSDVSDANYGYIGRYTGGYELFQNSGQPYKLNASTNNGNYGTQASAGDIIMVAFDADNSKLYTGLNGTWNNSSDPANGTSPMYTVTSGYAYTPSASIEEGVLEFNFGNGYFGTTPISSAGSNGNGSLFEYDVPSGFYALNTKNINTYG